MRSPRWSGSTVTFDNTPTFDNRPADVRVTAGPVGTVSVVGKTAIITGPFTPGPLALTITWDDGARTLHYTVSGPCCIAPHITGGTVKDGDTDVDPEAINSDGRIEIIFDQEVTGNITLETEDGDDVGWLGIVECNKGTLELVKGGELTNETIYVIRGRISDVNGNRG